MKKAEAREQVRSLWRQRPDGTRTTQHKMVFFQELKRDYPQVLNFRVGASRPDKYQIIAGWVNDLLEY